VDRGCGERCSRGAAEDGPNVTVKQNRPAGTPIFVDFSICDVMDFCLETGNSRAGGGFGLFSSVKCGINRKFQAVEASCV
jgi:hypothetical protein